MANYVLDTDSLGKACEASVCNTEWLTTSLDTKQNVNTNTFLIFDIQEIQRGLQIHFISNVNRNQESFCCEKLPIFL